MIGSAPFRKKSKKPKSVSIERSGPSRPSLSVYACNPKKPAMTTITTTTPMI